MISRETENVKSSEEIESAFRALSSEGKPYVTKEELYQVLPSALGRGVESPLKSKAGGCPLGHSSLAESAVRPSCAPSPAGYRCAIPTYKQTSVQAQGPNQLTHPASDSGHSVGFDCLEIHPPMSAWLVVA